VNVSFKFNGKTHSGISTRGVSKRYPSQLTIHLGQYQEEKFEKEKIFYSSINDIYGGGSTFNGYGGGRGFSTSINDIYGSGRGF